MFNPENAIKIAADSIATLRKCDVFRVIDWCDAANRTELAVYISTNRPELANEVTEIMEELA